MKLDKNIISERWKDVEKELRGKWSDLTTEDLMAIKNGQKLPEILKSRYTSWDWNKVNDQVTEWETSIEKKWKAGSKW